jgi:hypothetical protein
MIVRGMKAGTQNLNSSTLQSFPLLKPKTCQSSLLTQKVVAQPHARRPAIIRVQPSAFAPASVRQGGFRTRLKSQQSRLGNRITDGAYGATMEAIQNDEMPSFYFMHPPSLHYGAASRPHLVALHAHRSPPGHCAEMIQQGVFFF